MRIVRCGTVAAVGCYPSTLVRDWIGIGGPKGDVLKKNSRVMLFTAVVAVSAAIATIVFKSREPKSAVAADARPITCLCTKCEYHFEIAYEEYARAVKGEPGGTGGARVSAVGEAKAAVGGLRCESCGASDVVAANHCERHKVYYPNRNANGSLGRCSQCPVPS